MSKIILPGQDVKIDALIGVDPIWYEKLLAINKLVDALNTGNLAGLIADGGYSKGTWTPTLTFATPGNLAVTYNAITGGVWTKIGRLVSASFVLQTASFTFTTASGNLLVRGWPFTPNAANANYRAYAPLTFQGITKAGYGTMVGALLGNSTDMQVLASGSGQAVANVAATDTPTGGTVILGGVVNFIV
jgi:hypothetical protein